MKNAIRLSPNNRLGVTDVQMKTQKILMPMLGILLGLDLPANACTAVHAGTGQLVSVRERPGPSMFWAHASWDPDGWPAITYGPTYFHLPPIMQRLTQLHECAHLVEQSTNEFLANCRAIQVMRSQGLTPGGEAYIANYHQQIGALGPQYGGSGTAFWFGTMQTCASGTAPSTKGSY